SGGGARSWVTHCRSIWITCPSKFEIFPLSGSKLGARNPERCDQIEVIGDGQHSLWRSPPLGEVGHMGRILYELDCFRRDDCRSPRPVEVHVAVPCWRPLPMGCRYGARDHDRTDRLIAVPPEML